MLSKSNIDTIIEVEKFNPYHDARGRFASADSATSFTYKPGKGKMYDAAIAREKERTGYAPSKELEETPRMKAIHDAEDQIRHQNYETAVVIDKDGNEVIRKDGGQNMVGFTPMECFMLRNNTLTHNHPRSSMFSMEDTLCFARNEMEEMRATNREGVTYSIKRGEGYSRNKGMDFVSDYDSKYKDAVKFAQGDLDKRGFAEKIMIGEITQDQANKEFGRVVTNQMVQWTTAHASDYGVDFSVEKRTVTKSYEPYDTIVYKDDADVEFVLDDKTNRLEDEAFQEWLNGTHKTEKAAPKSVLFVGLQIANAENLAIEGGENHEDFHVTLAYGHFDQGGNDEDAVDVMVQSAIKDIRDLIPDKIHFDAIKRFEASESSDGKDVIYAQVAAGQLEKAHDGLLKALKKNGIKLEDTFPVYRPHMTLAYIDPGEEYELREIEASGDAVKVMIGHGHESSQENNYTIMKTDDDKRLVFGWASVSITVDGEQLEDRQHDMIDPEDLEEAVYDYVLNFRDTGEEHIPTMRKKGKLVESCVFTAEKQRAMGIPEGILPIGWWIGFKIEDDAAWEKVKNGTYKMFSIEGRANRVPVEKADAGRAMAFDEIIEQYK